jgi:sulfur carrier protein
MNVSGPDSRKDLLQSENGNGAVKSKISRQGRIELLVQGKPVFYDGPRDIRSLLESRGENSLYANVRINGDVLSRRDFENIPLSDGDRVDFLYFMGGGSRDAV